jgi:hypothetical protein
MRQRKDPTRYLIVARDRDDRWHNVHLGTLTPKQATQRHNEMLHRGARPANCQIWTKEQWLIYDTEEDVDIDAGGEQDLDSATHEVGWPSSPRPA